MRDELFEKVYRTIAGNLLIMNAWYRDGGYIEIDIAETLEDFSQPGVHFLHMRYVISNAEMYSNAEELHVRFRLKGYQHNYVAKVSLDAAIIRAKHPKPSEEWTLMYDL
jgi:hypothetical protein